MLVTDEPVPDREGYSAADAVIEVLVDAGLLADERLVERERHLVRDVPEGGFEIELHPAPTAPDQPRK